MSQSDFQQCTPLVWHDIHHKQLISCLFIKFVQKCPPATQLERFVCVCLSVVPEWKCPRIYVRYVTILWRDHARMTIDIYPGYACVFTNCHHLTSPLKSVCDTFVSSFEKTPTIKNYMVQLSMSDTLPSKQVVLVEVATANPLSLISWSEYTPQTIKVLC